MDGDRTSGWPYVPRSVLRSSSVMNRTFGCSCAIVTPAISSRQIAADTERIESRNLANAALPFPLGLITIARHSPFIKLPAAGFAS